MKKELFLFIALLFCSPLIVFGDVNLFTDNFNRPDNTDIDADQPTGITTIITFPDEIYHERDVEIYSDPPNDTGETLSNLENNALHLADGPNMGVLFLDTNLGTGQTALDILAEGGMKIGLTIASNDGSADDQERYVGFGLGNSFSECMSAGFDFNNAGFRGRNSANSGSSDIWIGWSPNSGGEIQVFKNGPSSMGGESFDIPGASLGAANRLELELRFDSFIAGTTVYANILWNAGVVGVTSFQWDHTGENYLGICARQNDQGFTIDNLSIEAWQPDLLPVLTDFSANPNQVDNDNSTLIDLSWTADFIQTGATYILSADKPVSYPNGNTGTAANGTTTVPALVNGTLGDVQFTLTLLHNGYDILSATTLVEAVAFPDSDAPNVIVILLDDTGWSDIGCYGSEIATPNIDKLAEGGVRFRNFYQAARCAPTRIAILSGLYTQQGAVNPANALPPPPYRQQHHHRRIAGQFRLSHLYGRQVASGPEIRWS